VYIDPNAPAPTAPEPGAAMGSAGSSLTDIITAANNGTLRVDPATGDATIRALTDIEDSIELYRRRLDNAGLSGTRLGGGYAKEIDRFNGDWTMSGPSSAMDVMIQYVAELKRLKEAVRKCMATYEHADAEGAAKVTEAGQPL
jgi:hypothetical protein